MIEVFLDDKTITIPEELSIAKFQQLHKVMDTIKNDSIKMLAFYLDIDENELKDLPVDSIELIQKYITEKYTNLETKELAMVFEYDGIEYGLETDWSKLPWGAWVDLEILSQEDVVENIHHIMAVIYRPIASKKGTKYELKKYKSAEVIQRKEIFRELPVKYWLGVTNFFFLLSTLLIENTKSSLEWKMKWNKLTIKGWERLPRFLKKRVPLDSILIGLSPSQKKIYQSFHR